MDLQNALDLAKTASGILSLPFLVTIVWKQHIQLVRQAEVLKQHDKALDHHQTQIEALWGAPRPRKEAQT